jgi:hypothetical protein
VRVRDSAYATFDIPLGAVHVLHLRYA